MQPIYGYGGRAAATFGSATGFPDTFFLQDPLYDVEEARAPLSPCMRAAHGPPRSAPAAPVSPSCCCMGMNQTPLL